MLAGVAALIVGVPALGDFWTFVATLAVIYALLGLSLVVLTGWTGQLNLHVAALGLGWGAYASFALTSVGTPPIVALLGAVILTVPFSLLIGFAAVRFRGLELAVATLALGLTFEQLVFRNLGAWLASGSNIATPFESSFVPVARPTLGPLSLHSDRAFYFLALGCGAAVYLVLRNLARGGTRRAMLALRERELAAEVAGLPALRYRTGAFVLSIAVAGLAGALFAGLKLGIAPDSFNLDLSFLVLAGVIIGGVRTLRGGAFGGALAAFLPEVVRFGPLRLIAGERLLFVFAAGLVATLALRPQGLLGPRLARLGRGGTSRRRPRSTARSSRNGSAAGTRRNGPAVLRAHRVSVHFGGVRALDDVELWVPQGEICALIGPNGAGKTTLFNALSGVVTPDSGRVYIGREDVTDMPSHRRAALGLGRTFQSIELFGGFTAKENLMIAAHVTRRSGPIAEALALPSARRWERTLAEGAQRILDSLDISHLAEAMPDELSSADLRRLELGSVLAREPKVVLLDEPTAGLDPEESNAIARLIAGLRDERSLTVLLVEHDMAVVGAVAEWVYVLDFGRVIASGSPARIRRDPLVVSRYLGEAGRKVAGARGA
jgi:ABC-type branched-subunit amino acid transport system ATPase component/ABC-type branched-subunit amino acid transport system permease subunit